MKYLLISLLFCNLIFGQFKNGIVTYTLLPKNDDGIENMLKEEDRYGLNKMTVEASTKLDVKLVFNKNKSCFYVENIERNKGTALAAALYLDAPTKIIVDLQKREIQRNNSTFFFKKEKYIYTDTLLTNWELSNEIKYIDKYRCYKASLKHPIESRKGTVIAWFCPELPYSFGPKGYGGLPGLILELIDNRGVVGMKSLNFNVLVDEDLLNIRGEETISSKKYHTMVKELIEE